MLFIALVLFLVGSQAYVLPPVPQLDGRILGGSPIEINQAPYQVALLFDYFNQGVFTHICSGTILGRRTILTAAQCTDGTSRNQWMVRAGSSFHDRDGIVIKSTNFDQHPFFDQRYNYDIVLVYLESRLDYGPDIVAARLPNQGADTPTNANAIVTGWGVTSETNITKPNQLQMVNATTIDHRECIEAYSDYSQVSDVMICIVGTGDELAGACYGDTGSPAAVNGLVVGVASWGDGCGDQKKPWVYASVASVRTWINFGILN